MRDETGTAHGAYQHYYENVPTLLQFTVTQSWPSSRGVVELRDADPESPVAHYQLLRLGRHQLQHPLGLAFVDQHTRRRMA